MLWLAGGRERQESQPMVGLYHTWTASLQILYDIEITFYLKQITTIVFFPFKYAACNLDPHLFHNPRFPATMVKR